MVEVPSPHNDHQPPGSDVAGVRTTLTLSNKGKTRLLNQILSEPPVTARQSRRIPEQVRHRRTQHRDGSLVQHRGSPETRIHT